jgi:polygalacturonase
VLDVGDDNIAVKAGGDRKSPGNRPSCTNFTVTDCTFLHGHGLSIGSETYGGMDGMTVRNCTFDGTTSGIRMKSNRERGGLVRNLRYDGISMVNVKTPVSITSYYPKTPAKPSDDPAMPVKLPAPEWKNIEISNLTATGSKNAGVIWGLPELPVTGVTFRKVTISAETGMKIYNARDIRLIDTSITVSKGDKIITENAMVSGLPAKAPGN